MSNPFNFNILNVTILKKYHNRIICKFKLDYNRCDFNDIIAVEIANDGTQSSMSELFQMTPGLIRAFRFKAGK